MTKEYDKDEVIQRLINEQLQSRVVLDGATRALSQDSRFQDLSLIGGVKAVLRTLHETEKELREANAFILKEFGRRR